MIAFLARLGVRTGAGIVAVALVFAAPAAAANPLDEGRRAYNRGDFAAALKLWLPLAEAGNIEAQMEVGGLYTWGFRGVEKNEAEGLKWWRRAAERGNATAQYRVGYGYEVGRGVARDLGEAARWYRKAADDHDDRYAQHSLGQLYANGLGVAQDYGAAATWYRRSADQWFWEAQYALGELYSEGKGVPRDLVQAYMWFTLARNSAGTEEERQSKIRQAMERLAKGLSPAEIQRAEGLAARFPPYSGRSR